MTYDVLMSWLKTVLEVHECSSLIKTVKMALCTILLGQHVLDVHIITMYFEKFLTGKMSAL